MRFRSRCTNRNGYNADTSPFEPSPMDGGNQVWAEPSASRASSCVRNAHVTFRSALRQKQATEEGGERRAAAVDR